MIRFVSVFNIITDDLSRFQRILKSNIVQVEIVMYFCSICDPFVKVFVTDFLT